MPSRIDIVFLIIIILLIVLLVNNPNEYYIEKNENDILCDSETVLNCFYKNYKNINKLNRPKVFIHISNEKNERNWINFGSRTTTDLNLDICELCIESVINNLVDKYDIILYTNDDAKKIIDDEKDYLSNIENIDLLSGIDLEQWEEYCKFRILHKYGGIVMSPYFLFSKCPANSLLNPKTLTVCSILNEGINSLNKKVIPSKNFMILAPKKDKHVVLYLNYLRQLCYHSYGADNKFFDRSFESLLSVNTISPEQIGVLDHNNKPIYTENILSTQKIILNPSNFCLFINIDLLKKNRKYGWILKMNKKQIKESNFFLAKYSNLI